MPTAGPMNPSDVTGLTDAEAARRLAAEGPNELPGTDRRTTLDIALEVIREPMFLLLVACGTLYMVMGEPGDAAMLLGFVVVVMSITIVQERRTERALDALRDLSSPRARVVRGGVAKTVAGREVVRGDWMVLAEGDRIPADAVLRSAINLSTDESLLTGESVPVRKSHDPEATAMSRPGGDDLPFVFSGSLVTAGQGVAEVLATGSRTELGKIGTALGAIEPEDTLLQRETGRLVRRLAIVGIILCLVVVVVYALTRGGSSEAWTKGVLAGITMAMSILPEELPVILTIFLALGAWRISQFRVLARRMPAVETLGAATVLCTDKTGTLTMNRMTIRRLFADGEVFLAGDGDTNLPESFHLLLEYGVLACKREPFDPMEKAFLELGSRTLQGTEHLHERWTLVHEYPLSPRLLALSHVWRATEDRSLYVATKGAPEAVADLCHLPENARARMIERVLAMADEGLRILGVARARLPEGDLPTDHHDLTFEFLGLVGLEDPVRPTVPAAVAECSTAGIRVVMITGDYAGTARNIARRIGLPRPEDVITGPELDALADDALVERLKTVDVFARVVPEQKLRIVNALKAAGEIVAMTGDGVNDAPALKAAHIGVAMGGRGTDVAREAASLVLLDDDFASIVAAVRMGRRIFDNIKKAIGYVLAVHVPIAGLSMIPVFFADWPLLLLPVHVLFLELIIDPACSIIFEAEEAEPDTMRRPPRNPAEPLFNGRAVILSLLQGLFVLGVILALFHVSAALGHPSDDARRAFVFTALVAANLGLILTNRSWTRTAISMLSEPNAALWWVVGGASAFLAAVLAVPALRDLFHLMPLHRPDVLLCLGAAVASVAWFDVVKLLRRPAGA